MRNGEVVTFCEDCPLKGSCDGPIDHSDQYTVDASFFAVTDKELGIPISLGTFFYDTDGGKSEQFAPEPYTTIEDVAACHGLVVVAREGLRRRAIKDCGAHLTSGDRFRTEVFGSPEGASRKRRRF